MTLSTVRVASVMLLLVAPCLAGVTKRGEAQLEARPLRILSLPSRFPGMSSAFEDVSRLAFSPDGKTLATGGENCGLHFWNARTGKEKQLSPRLDSTYALAFSPDGALFGTGTSDLVGVGLWSARSGALIRTLKEPYPASRGAHVFDFAFSPDGRTLAATSCRDIQLWDVATGHLVRKLKGSKCQTNLMFSRDGKTLACAAFSKTGSSLNTSSVLLWDVKSGTVKRTLPRIGFPIAFSPDGRFLITRAFGQNYKSSAACWNVRSGTLKWRASGNITANGDAEPVAVSRDGRVLATGHADGTIQLRDAQTGSLLQSLRASNGTILSVAFSPDGSVLASGDSKAKACLWRIPLQS